MNKLKAYVVSSDDMDDGQRLVFAETPGKAKELTDFDSEYIYLRAYRKPEMDKHVDIAVNNQLDWNIPEHRKILEDELGWIEID